ncbi:MAG: hybrid sensor histidine kinase/response regulator [ANME-2 cluster archaeon]|jgi:signal transduction histidine kinase|nr:hybrid sensor histidine kinase/response regulator [ANME-2 cluster archaeon]
MTILVVDDSKADRILLTKILENGGFEVVTAVDGKNALEMIRSDAPDMIITDIMMPVIDGFQLCREVKQDPALMNIPLVFYTASYREEDDEALAMRIGAAAFFRKPEEPHKIINSVKKILEEYKSGKTEPQQPLISDEKEYLALYSSRLVKKLEDKFLELESANTKLEAAYDELKSIDRLKDNIISNVTHELRTPIMLAGGFLELALDETDPIKRNQHLTKSIDALKREDKIVIDLIETATAEKGLLKPFTDTIDLGKIITAAVENLKPKVTIYDINIDVSFDGDLIMLGDYYQLKHVMINLIDNAIKFNVKQGKVEINATEDNGQIQVCIKDTGIGIPGDKLVKIFDKLYQIESDTNRKYGGTGIGLTIAKHIIEGHGGSIWVKSEVGEGSTFCFNLPK